MTNLQSLIPPPQTTIKHKCTGVTHKHTNPCTHKVHWQTKTQVDSNTNLCCQTSYKSRGEKSNAHKVMDYACMWHSNNNSHVWPLQTVQLQQTSKLRTWPTLHWSSATWGASLTIMRCRVWNEMLASAGNVIVHSCVKWLAWCKTNIGAITETTHWP